jgi:RNA polymerase sigma-70 factor (ECF subfamily)
MPDRNRVEPTPALNLDAQLALFSEKLARLAQRHLDTRLARRLDGEDVVQSAFRTFLRRNALGEFQIADAADLWKLLVRITVLKARAKGRFHTADRRDIGHEVNDGNEWLSQLAFGEPDETEALALVETVESLLRDVPDWYAAVLEMRLSDHSATDIALELKLSRQSVQRALRVLRDRLEQQLASKHQFRPESG